MDPPTCLLQPSDFVQWKRWNLQRHWDIHTVILYMFYWIASHFIARYENGDFRRIENLSTSCLCPPITIFHLLATSKYEKNCSSHHQQSSSLQVHLPFIERSIEKLAFAVREKKAIHPLWLSSLYWKHRICYFSHGTLPLGCKRVFWKHLSCLGM